MTGPQRARKKPVEIEYVVWDGTDSTFEELELWCGDDTFFLDRVTDSTDNPRWYNQLLVKTLEGPLHASEGDVIIRGVQGEFYPIKDAIFRETYDLVE